MVDNWLPLDDFLKVLVADQFANKVWRSLIWSSCLICIFQKNFGRSNLEWPLYSFFIDKISHKIFSRNCTEGVPGLAWNQRYKWFMIPIAVDLVIEATRANQFSIIHTHWFTLRAHIFDAFIAKGAKRYCNELSC